MDKNTPDPTFFMSAIATEHGIASLSIPSEHRCPRPGGTTERNLTLTILPTEILAEIRLWLYTLENPWTDSHGNRNLCYIRKNSTFALVCRRFHSIESGIPLLWAAVSDQMSLEGAKLYIDRSAACGLFVRVMVDSVMDWYRISNGARCRCEMWRLIAGEAGRWEAAEIVVFEERALYRHDEDDGHDDGHTETCFSVFQGLVLPKLRWLVVKIEDKAAVDIIKSWSIPRLRDLRCDPPDVLFQLRLSSPLEALFLNMTPTDRSPIPSASFLRYVATAPGADELLRLLASQVGLGLQSLRLIMGGYSLREPRPEQPVYPHLPLLKSLELYFSQSTEDQAPIDWLFSHIHAPALEEVSITYTDSYGSPDVVIRWLELLNYRATRVVGIELVCCWDEEENEEFLTRISETLRRSVEHSGTSPPALNVKFSSRISYRFY